MKPKPKYRRILLKLSGEALSGQRGFGLDADTLARISGEIASARMSGVNVAVVIGGGNFLRGGQSSGLSMERTTADYMGMLATLMNALALKQALQNIAVDCCIQSAISITPISEPYVREVAIDHLNQGRVVIFGAGTGNPLFTTDTAASLRGIEIGADILLKATDVDGVYNRDPKCYDDAVRYQRISFDDVITGHLRVMDATAFALCREHGMPLRVFSLLEPGNLKRVVLGEEIGTLVTNEVESE